MGAPMFGMKYNTIQVEPVSGALGAEVRGVDLAKDLSAEVVADVQRALMDHLVIFFRDQIMTPEQQKAFGRRFGELHIHPITEPMKGHPEIIEVIKEADELGNWGDEWHTDLTALPEPPLGSILYAKEVPPFSGDTQFSNMYLAYETLSSDFRRFLDGLDMSSQAEARRLFGLQVDGKQAQRTVGGGAPVLCVPIRSPARKRFFSRAQAPAR